MKYKMITIRKFNRAVEGGGPGGRGTSSNGCGGVDSITWASEPSSEFLQDSDIESATKAIKNVVKLFPDLTTSFTAIKSESEAAFSYDGSYPIEAKAKEIEGVINQIENDMSELPKGIETAGQSHQTLEAKKYYLEVRKRLIKLSNDVQGAVQAYNKKRSSLITQYMINNSSRYTNTSGYGYDQSAYNTVLKEANNKYGDDISVTPAEPYLDNLATTLNMPSGYKSTIDDGAVKAAIEGYNHIAKGKGQEAEDLKAKYNITIGDNSSKYSTYDKVAFGDTGLSEEARKNYNSESGKPMDLHYYGTIEVTGKDGKKVMVPVYYDANEQNPTYTGGAGKKNASRLFVVQDGQICYLTNTDKTTAHNDTHGDGKGEAGTAFQYDISIPINKDDGTPADETGHYTVYNNHDAPDNVQIGSGGWSDQLYYKDPDGETYEADWSTIQRGNVDLEDNSEHDGGSLGSF